MIKLHYFWGRQLLLPTLQPKLELQGEDSIKSINCPIYTNAIKSAVYLISPEPIDIEWFGGHEYSVKVAPWWQETYDAAKLKWASTAIQRGFSEISKFRYRLSSPLGAKDGGAMLHAGGLMLNFFTGMSIQTDPGVKTMVLPAMNRFTPNWSVQQGIYDSDQFPGDFSFNFQIMKQVPIHIPAYHPLVCLVPFTPDSANFVVVNPESSETKERWVQSTEWHFKKSELGQSYDKIRKCPVHSIEP